MNTVKLITEASDFNDSNYLIEEDEKGKKELQNQGYLYAVKHKEQKW